MEPAAAFGAKWQHPTLELASGCGGEASCRCWLLTQDRGLNPLAWRMVASRCGGGVPEIEKKRG